MVFANTEDDEPEHAALQAPCQDQRLEQHLWGPPAAAAARLVVAAEARGTQGADGRVRQAAEQSTAGGVTW